MSQATVSFKTDSKIKKQYETFAKNYGLTPSALLNIQMRQLIEAQTLTIWNPWLQELEIKEVTPAMKKAISKSKKTKKALLHNI